MANATLDLDFDKAAAKSISRRDNAAGSPTSKQPGRIATKTAAIDQSQTISFTWEGDKLAAHPGDTLASALLANGVRLTSRSFKY
ncbi:MAG: 2Fe-2S iron-sulfur cluster-binding protein, partial [Pseudomonadota bacterium]